MTSGEALPPDLPQPGSVIVGKYRLDGVIGIGGMGVVYRGYHQLLGIPIAIKVVLPEIAKRPEVVARFINEAKASAIIQSEHVARVTDVGTLDDHTPFMVMELLEGNDLEHILEQQGPPSISLAVDWMMQALAGLNEAHAAGIIHRDLKPSNLFLVKRAGRADHIKICDFGISKATFEGAGAQITSTNSVLGSPAYMAPEQLRSSKTVDARADIWSLGIILYELLTGATPFTGENVGAVFAAILESTPTPPRMIRPEIPDELGAIIMKCLERRPADRFTGTKDLALALAPYSSNGGRKVIERLTGPVLGSTLIAEGPSGANIAMAVSSELTLPPIARSSTPSFGNGEAAAGVQASNRYRPIAELGRGGMATVYLSVVQGPAGFNKLQVVKRLRPALAADPEFLNMFLEEARLSARISHTNVVQTNEVGFDGQNYFIAMEYLEGQSFEAILRRAAKQGAPFARADQLRVISEVLKGLHFAHELTDFDGTKLSVVHRDVSPHNIIVTYDGEVKLLDFGIAKAADSSQDTRTGILKGKCAYMAPEQFGGKDVDRRADVFAVGVILWQALTGDRLWKGLSDAEIFQKLATGQIPTPSEVNPNVPERLNQICTKALAQKASDRYRTALDFQTDLEEYIHANVADRATARTLGRDVTEMFADARAELRTLVERQLKASPSKAGTPVPILGGSTTGSGLLSVETGPGISPTQKKKRTWQIAASIVALLAITGTGFSLSKGKPTATADHATLSAITITANPPTARIFVDDAPLPSNPAKVSFARDGTNHRVRAEAFGFVTKTELVVADSTSIAVDVALERAPELSALTPPSAHPTTSAPTPTGNVIAISRPNPTTSVGAPRVDPSSSASNATTAASVEPPPSAAPSGKLHGLDTTDPWKRQAP